MNDSNMIDVSRSIGELCTSINTGDPNLFRSVAVIRLDRMVADNKAAERCTVGEDHMVEVLPSDTY